jgi:hypothetical protein
MTHIVTEHSTSDDKLYEYRVAMFEEMGFSNKIACMLAATRGDDGFLVSTHQVRDMIENGCSHELALKIVL